LPASGKGGEVGVPGTLLGIVADPQLADGRLALHAGDALVLYTDGVTDASAPQHVNTPEELARVVGPPVGQSADAIAERMMEAVLGGSDGEPRDDIAILVLKVPDERIRP
jgi:sigma-B regulation protein RsbU (phosphoserine phosphatase)